VTLHKSSQASQDDGVEKLSFESALGVQPELLSIPRSLLLTFSLSPPFDPSIRLGFDALAKASSPKSPVTSVDQRPLQRMTRYCPQGFALPTMP
jgi:hypothetical protein